MKMQIALIAVVVMMGSGCDAAKDAASDLIPGQDAGPVVVEMDAGADAQIKDLDDDDKSKVCDKVVNAINSGVPASGKCDFGGLGAGASAVQEGIEAVRERCATFADTCKEAALAGGSAAQDQIPEVTFDSCAVLKGDVSNCTASVSDLTACLTDMAKAMVHTVEEISCEALTLDGLSDTGLGALGSAVPDTPVCAELAAACPGVFGPGGGGGGADAGAPPADGGVGDAG